jgi:hypothetical protein
MVLCDSCFKPFAATDFNWTATGGALCDRCMLTEYAEYNDQTLDDILATRHLEWWAGFFGWQRTGTKEQTWTALKRFYAERGIVERVGGVLVRLKIDGILG